MAALPQNHQHSATTTQQQEVAGNKLQAIIFDVDGTLADTEQCGHLVAYNHVFNSLDLPWRWDNDEYRQLLKITGGGERLRHYLQNEQACYSVPNDDREAFAADLHGRKNSHYQQLVRENLVPLRPGVQRLIAEAHNAGIRLAIATASHPQNVASLLQQTLGDASQWFEVIAGGEQVKAKKPAPDIYRYVLEKLGLEADNVIAIEDSEQGLQSALRAGLRTLVTSNFFTDEHDFSGAMAVVDHLGEPDQPCHFRDTRNSSRMVDLAVLQQLTNSEPAPQLVH